MASIRERNGKYCVIYYHVDPKGKRRQRWETYDTKAEAKRRCKEITYKEELGTVVVMKCKTLNALLDEYIDLYGKDNWALSTYQSNTAMIDHYIRPLIGDVKLSELTTRYIEKYYQTLLHTPAVVNPYFKKTQKEYVQPGTIQHVHRLLRSCFEQACKWDVMDKNPCQRASVPKAKTKKREIWTADTIIYVNEVCEDNYLKLAINLAFAASLRMGELQALTWDCVDISEEAIAENRAYIYINKELQRADKEAIRALDGKDVLMIFPEEKKSCKTVRVLKTPKTESSVRKVFLPKSVALMLVDWKAQQDEIKSMLGEEYNDYDLVMATSFGMPTEGSHIRKGLKDLIEKYNLPPVVFHSLRHSSVTYKLKLNGGDIKAVQGDSGHSQINMVTDVYSHIIDEDRRKNAELMEEAFYTKKDPDPQMLRSSGASVSVPEGVDAAALAKVLANPEMAALLMTLAKSL